MHINYRGEKVIVSDSKGRTVIVFFTKCGARASSEEHVTEVIDDYGLVGEDAATFDLEKQKLSSWLYFTAILGVVLFVLNLIWIDVSTGFGGNFSPDSHIYGCP
ncbi:hypothetical protein RYX36_027756 [Vicia faba]